MRDPSTRIHFTLPNMAGGSTGRSGSGSGATGAGRGSTFDSTGVAAAGNGTAGGAAFRRGRGPPAPGAALSDDSAVAGDGIVTGGAAGAGCGGAAGPVAGGAGGCSDVSAAPATTSPPACPGWLASAPACHCRHARYVPPAAAIASTPARAATRAARPFGGLAVAAARTGRGATGCGATGATAAIGGASEAVGAGVAIGLVASCGAASGAAGGLTGTRTPEADGGEPTAGTGVDGLNGGGVSRGGV